MAQGKRIRSLAELLLERIEKPDTMFYRLEWLCSQRMETEISQQLRTRKS